jgi:hypothetical protein
MLRGSEPDRGRDPPGRNSEGRTQEPITGPGDERQRSTFRRALRTWPGKALAFLLTAVVGSALSYFLGADFWQGVEKRVGVAAAPISVQVLTDVDRFESNSGVDAARVPEFTIPRPISQIPPPPAGSNPQGRYKWAHHLGGIDTGSSLVRLIVSGTSESPVLVQDLQIKVVSRERPIQGSLISFLGQGAGQAVRFFEIDLDDPQPTAEYVGSEGGPEARFPLRVTSTETEVFDLLAHTEGCDCSWVAELAYTAEGEDGLMTIDGGQPFRTTAHSIFQWAPGENDSISFYWSDFFYWDRGWQRYPQAEVCPLGPAGTGDGYEVGVEGNVGCGEARRVLANYLGTGPVAAGDRPVAVEAWICAPFPTADPELTQRLGACTRRQPSATIVALAANP